MGVFKCEMENFFPSADPSEKWPCEVRTGDGKIVVSYEEEEIGGYALYEGSEIAPGRFRLKCENPKGTATLSLVNGRLEGSWIESGETGMWAIDAEDGNIS